MAFNINAHVILNGPKNIKAITKNIQSQLGNIKATVQIQLPKNINKELGSISKGMGNLNKQIALLRDTATSTNSKLASLETRVASLSKISSRMAKSQSATQKSLSKTGDAVRDVGNEIEAFGKDAALAIRRFAAFTVATGVVFGFVRAVTSATKAAIDYEREITKIIQVTGAGTAKIEGLNKSIDRLSTSLGVDANELAELARIFAQTGQSIDQVEKSIRAVARSSLTPTFGSMKDTAEGLIAAMAQFGIQASQQEAVLASLNAVSKKFAVEAEDLISVIRRAGGVFAASKQGFETPIEGLQQLAAIFTAVRSTSRESADTISVGLRTIFTRIQRGSTIEFLKQFNIELVDAQGNFVGLFPAFQKLSKGLDRIIKSGDALTLSKITEELGGVRQVGKLIPAITQFNKALAATEIAGRAAREGLGKDVALGLQPLGKQFEILQQRFQALVRTISESQTFQNLAKVALSIGNAFLSITEALTPLIPLITTFAAIKISRGMVDFGQGFFGGLKKGGGAGGAGGALGSAVTGGGGGKGPSQSNAALITSQQSLTGAIQQLVKNIGGGSSLVTTLGNINSSLGNVNISIKSLIGAIGRSQMSGGAGAAFAFRGSGGRRGPRKFAKGGFVSGPSHSQGGVPAILEGGEYVLPKGFRNGSKVPHTTAAQRKARAAAKERKADLGRFPGGLFTTAPGAIGGFFLQPESGSDLDYTTRTNTPFELNGQKAAISKGSTIKGFMPHRNDLKKNAAVNKIVRSGAQRALNTGVTHSSPKLFDFLDVKPQIGLNRKGIKGAANRLASDGAAINAVTGYLFEGIIQAISGAKLAGGTVAFDFPNVEGAKSGLSNLFTTGPASLSGLIKADARRTRNDKRMKEIVHKLIQDIQSGDFMGVAQKFAAGGSVFKPRGSDTVPAMLTPGEFVVNKSSAQKVGYGNLSKINRYAQGGVVSSSQVQYLNRGSGPTWRQGPAGPVQVGGGGQSDALGQNAGRAAAALGGLAAMVMTFNTQDPIGSLTQSLTGLMFIMPDLIATMGQVKTQFAQIRKSGGGLGKQLKTGLGKSLSGVKGLLVAAIAGPLINAIGGQIIKTFIGVEKRLGNITGIQGASAAGGGAAGAIQQGGAVGQVLLVGGQLTALALKVHPILAGVVAALTGIAAIAIPVIGYLDGFRQQLRFIEMTKTDEALNKFRKSLEELKKDLSDPAAFADVAREFQTAFKSAASTVAGDQRSGEMPKWYDRMANWSSTNLMGFDPSAGMLGGGRGDRSWGERWGASEIGGLVNLMGSSLPGGTTPTEGMEAFNNRKEIANRKAQARTLQTSLSDVNALFTDEDMKGLEDLVSDRMAKLMKTISSATLKQMAAVGAGDLKGFTTLIDSVGPAAQQSAAQLKELLAALTRAQLFRDMEKEMGRLQKQAEAFKGTVQGNQAQAKLERLSQAFNALQQEVDLSTASADEIDSALEKIRRQYGLSTIELERLIETRRVQSAEDIKAAQVMEMLNREAAKAKRGIDALAAGLEQFGARTTAVGDMAERAGSRASDAFSQLTGKRTVGQVERFSPFENVAGASDSQIESGIARLQGMGGRREGGVAFQGLGAAIKAQRDLPLVMKQTVSTLESQAAGGQKITNAQFKDAIANALGAGQFANLPKEMREAINTELQARGTGQQGGAQAFTIDTARDMLTKQGGLIKLLGPAAQKVTTELAKADSALLQFQNAILTVADLEQQMMQRRLDHQLAIEDKENSIRDRLNKALGRTPNAAVQARNDLERRTGTLTRGMPRFGQDSDPNRLSAIIRSAESQAQVERKKLGIGVDEDPRAAADRLARQGKLSKEMQQSAHRLAKLNTEINGAKQAMKEFAENTTVLAALEGELAKIKAKEKAAGASGVSIVQGLHDLATGKITDQQFGQQIVAPLQNVEDAFSGKIGTGGAMDLLKRMESGDQLTAGLINSKIAEVAAATQESPEDVRTRFIENLTQGIMRSGIAGATGMGKEGIATILKGLLGQKGALKTESQKIAHEMQIFSNKQIEMLKAQQALEEEGFKKLMDKVKVDFEGVVQQFAKAVEEFSKFREDTPQARRTGGTAGTASSSTVTLSDGRTVNIPASANQAAINATDAMWRSASPEQRRSAESFGTPTINIPQASITVDEFQGGMDAEYGPQLAAASTAPTDRAGRLGGSMGLMSQTRQGIRALEGRRGEVNTDSLHGQRKVARIDRRIQREKETLQRQEEAFNRHASVSQKKAESDRIARQQKLKDTMAEGVALMNDDSAGDSGSMASGGSGLHYGREPISPEAQQMAHDRYGPHSLSEERAAEWDSNNSRRHSSRVGGVGSIPQPPSVARQGTAMGVAGGVLPDLAKIFSDGANTIANTLTAAFEKIPPTIQMNATLGAITVNLTGGQFLEQFREGIVTQLRNEIHDGTIRGITGVKKDSTADELSADAPNSYAHTNPTSRSQQSALTRRFGGRRRS